MSEIDLTEVQRRDGTREQLGLRATLNRAFWGSSSETDNSALVGSWGKDTRVRPPRDIDVLFLLPPALYHQFQGRSGNRQSQLLQHVKGVLEQSYSRTTMRGDGQVIIVPFVIPIEVAIGFACQDGSIIVCDTNNGGTYRSSTAAAEASNISLSDLATHGNTRALIRMLKQWQRHRGVPLKSFQLESLAVDFLWLWSFSGRDIFWYDWMMRDFFAYLVARANGQITMPGTGEALPLGTDWCRHAQQAHADAISACDAERDNDDFRAGLAWQAIFGSAAPLVLG